ncbi:MAG: hypothetical protein NTU49_09190, partial [Gammaproteobacteria bacterium]|nr:hypothetical protein [Gammaproteobacteria bacterium]
NGAAQLPGNIIWLALNTVTCGTVSETVVASCCCRDEYCPCCATEKGWDNSFYDGSKGKDLRKAMLPLTADGFADTDDCPVAKKSPCGDCEPGFVEKDLCPTLAAGFFPLERLAMREHEARLAKNEPGLSGRTAECLTPWNAMLINAKRICGQSSSVGDQTPLVQKMI